ncbi:MAG: hypothetical protein ACXWYM_00310 [Candidatus Binatia bacterium]
MPNKQIKDLPASASCVVGDQFAVDKSTDDTERVTGTQVAAMTIGAYPVIAALAVYNSNGILVQTSQNNFASRTLTGTANQIVITNGDGVSGNPTFDIGANVLTNSSTHTMTNKTFDANGTGNAISNLETADFAANVVDTDGTLAANSNTRIPTQAAVRTAINALIGANDVEVFRGVIDCSANPDYPAADAGHAYRISVAGKIGGASGVNVEIGDRVQCITDGSLAGNHATVGANWWITQVNVDGAVVGPTSATDGNIALFDSTTGKLIKNSAYSPSSFQAVDQALTDISGLAVTDGNFIVGDGVNWVAESGATVRASLGLTIGTHVQEYDADTMKSDVTANLTVGYTTTSYNAGTKTTGTFTPDPALGNFQHAVNGGAHTLAPPANACAIIIEYLNNGSAGAITTSGFTKVTGTFTTTDTNKFHCSIIKGNSYSSLDIRALQ